MTTEEKHITRTGSDYAHAFAQLLPRGRAWPRNPNSTLMKVVSGLSQIWGYVEERASVLLERETDPRITVDLLPEWERAFGLPDDCLAEPLTVADRQIALVNRMTTEGGQSREFFIAIAAGIGYAITITEYRPFMVGVDRTGDNRVIGDGSLMYDVFGHPILNESGTPVENGQYSEYPYTLGPPENRFYWTVHVGEARLSWFRVSSGQVGVDPHLRIGIATDLECLLGRLKPAHTEIIFDYSGLSNPGDPMAGTP